MADSDRPHPLSREPWRTRSTRPVYENPWIKVREDVALLPDGRTKLILKDSATGDFTDRIVSGG